MQSIRFTTKLAWSTACLLELLLVMLAGCGGGGGSTSIVNKPSNPYTSVEIQQMQDVKSTVVTVYEQQIATGSEIDAAAAVVSAVKKMPGVTACGASSDGSTIRMRFSDGTEFAIGSIPDIGPITNSTNQIQIKSRDISNYPNTNGNVRLFCSDVDAVIESMGNRINPQLNPIGCQYDNYSYRGTKINPNILKTSFSGSKIIILAIRIV